MSIWKRSLDNLTNGIGAKKVSEYDQEIPESHTADQTMTT